MDVEVIATPGLGNSAYLIASGGEAVAVDPPRDAWRIARVAEARGWRISHALETHVHNDYLSGARELRRSLGARIVAPARGRYRFAHVGADEGYELPIGDLGLVARATPGHTPEHVAWEVRGRDGRPLALFSGGSLLMAGVGRTDLLGPTRMAELTGAQYATMGRLRELPDDVLVFPTHGAGSFCVAGASDGPRSATIGALRMWNPAFTARDRAAFERLIAEGRTRFPSYYRRMAPINRRGPRLLGSAPRPPELDLAGLLATRADGVRVVDVRDRRDFADGHLAGALNIGLEDSFAGYVGWLVPFDAPLALIVPAADEAVMAVLELLRIGYDHVVGYLRADVPAWEEAGAPVRRYPVMNAADLAASLAQDPGAATRLIDVRQPAEWRDGVVPGSRRIFVADLPAALGGLDRTSPWTVACKAGPRAAIAASILDAADIPVRLVARGGVPSLPSAELVPG